MSERRNRGAPTQTHDSSSRLMNPARIYAEDDENRSLDSIRLSRLEESFRKWAGETTRGDTRRSRLRVLLIFLLIRYTGARLSEVQALRPAEDIDFDGKVIRFRKKRTDGTETVREAQVSTALLADILSILKDFPDQEDKETALAVDAAHVRRKFYERAIDCGFDKETGTPHAIRRARAVEMMRDNLPLPVVQRMMGHSNPNLTASFIEFSENDMDQVARHFIERERKRTSSARNCFFGKISNIINGDIQSLVEVHTTGSGRLVTVITNYSLQRMGLKPGSLVTAEVKAPWVTLQKDPLAPVSSAENVFNGEVVRTLKGALTTEYVIRLDDGTELCSLVTEESRRKLALKETDRVWAMFNSSAVILHVD